MLVVQGRITPLKISILFGSSLWLSSSNIQTSSQSQRRSYELCVYELSDGECVEVLCIKHLSTAFSLSEWSRVYQSFVKNHKWKRTLDWIFISVLSVIAVKSETTKNSLDMHLSRLCIWYMHYSWALSRHKLSHYLLILNHGVFLFISCKYGYVTTDLKDQGHV